MSVALRYLTLQEVSAMTEKLAGLCRQLGVSQGDLDRCIDAALDAFDDPSRGVPCIGK